jgi:hypothetical protein
VDSISEALSNAIDDADKSREKVRQAKLDISGLSWKGEAEKAAEFLGLRKK